MIAEAAQQEHIMSHTHNYETTITWTGNKGQGTADYKAYDRDYTVSAAGKPDALWSSDPAFRGDPSRYNPEDTLVASLSGCHMLWYLHFCAEAGIIVEEYQDKASGVMVVAQGGKGQFENVTLHPRVKITDKSRTDEANKLHDKAHDYCFIARSVNFPVDCESEVYQ